MVNRDKLKSLWGLIYDQESRVFEGACNSLERACQKVSRLGSSGDESWYQRAIVYCLYVDRFADNFKGLTKRLDYLVDLGVNCLWLLPILDSPMKDDGFDVRDYYRIRSDLLDSDDPNPNEFQNFLLRATELGIRIIFDLVLNHCSSEHEKFQEALSSPTADARNFFIWRDSPDHLKDCRIIFQGLEDSVWSHDENTKTYYLHRFYAHQPDWNYENPEVLLQTLEVMLYWKIQGISGFRLDAVPFLWKEEGTDCENHFKTHAILKFLRAAMDFVEPGTLLLAEACQPPHKLISYFGSGDEVQGAYHFPLMPNIFLALAQGSSKPLAKALSQEVTPIIPKNCTWFSFLRCHDELTLEMVSPQDKELLNQAYCKDTDWQFRNGGGIAARLAELLNFNPCQILLAHALMLTLEGVPVLYYGDEFAMANQPESLKEFERRTGKRDSRALVRGKIDWQKIENQLSKPESLPSQIFYPLKEMIWTRKNHFSILQGSVEFLETSESLCVYKRRVSQDKEILFVNNLKNTEITFSSTDILEGVDLINQVKITIPVDLAAFQFLWLQISSN